MEGLAEIITDFFNSIDPKRTSAGPFRIPILAVTIRAPEPRERP
jgi:hypothetical protein